MLDHPEAFELSKFHDRETLDSLQKHGKRCRLGTRREDFLGADLIIYENDRQIKVDTKYPGSSHGHPGRRINYIEAEKICNDPSYEADVLWVFTADRKFFSFPIPKLREYLIQHRSSWELSQRRAWVTGCDGRSSHENLLLFPDSFEDVADSLGVRWV